MTNPYRELPSVNQLMTHFNDVKHERLVALCREVLEQARERIESGSNPSTEAELVAEIQIRLATEQQLSLRQVINATGVILHTNLGRAPLAQAALQAIEAVSGGYSTLEYNLEAGQRGHRDQHIEGLIRDVTGAEAAIGVNNNAAAVYLVLAGLAQGREVVISRGELVEIGGGFRIPDVMRESGAHLVEVGTTNRTRLCDFENAITPQTTAFMRVHSSNFKMLGFTEATPLSDLVTLAHEHGLLVLDDLGSGALLDTAPFSLAPEPMVQTSIAAGVDVVMFSGDKLLGGPQAGIIIGKAEPINRLRRHPLMRALRPDKLCLAALAATLQLYRDTDPLQTIPVWQMISTPLAELERRAKHWQSILGGEVLLAESTIGGGSLPGETLSTQALTLTVANPDAFAQRLRQANPPVIVRIQEDKIWLDPRTVLPQQEDILLRILGTYLT